MEQNNFEITIEEVQQILKIKGISWNGKVATAHGVKLASSDMLSKGVNIGLKCGEDEMLCQMFVTPEGFQIVDPSMTDIEPRAEVIIDLSNEWRTHMLTTRGISYALYLKGACKKREGELQTTYWQEKTIIEKKLSKLQGQVVDGIAKCKGVEAMADAYLERITKPCEEVQLFVERSDMNNVSKTEDRTKNG